MKKLLALMLVMGMLILPGCGGTAADDQTAADNQSTQEAEAVAEDAAAADDQDAQGAEVISEDAAASAGSSAISEDEAKKIAAEHAGFKVEDVKFTKFKKDKDDGVWQYEIEFVAGDKEYEYDINMATGDIMDYDVDSVYDD